MAGVVEAGPKQLLIEPLGIRFGDDDLAREHWGVFDQMTMMQQLGVVPSGPPA